LFDLERTCPTAVLLTPLILLQILPPQTPSQRPHPPTVAQDDTGALKFTDIMNNLQHVYPKQQLADISTSYGFICLLHLANEKGLVIENVDGWGDLMVRPDFGAVIGEGGD
jgi:condensin complex subunit 2